MQLRRPRASGEAAERERYLSALNQARMEYDVARSCFGEAVEPEIIDQAILLMEAARKKYSYFLKKVRDSHWSSSLPQARKGSGTIG
jgi:hypothetical protein